MMHSHDEQTIERPTMLRDSIDAFFRNRDPILGVLRDALPTGARVLEVGSGSGHHAHYMASHLPQCVWQPSDRPGWLESLESQCVEAALSNVLEPVALDLLGGEWPAGPFDAVVAINVLHIAPARACQALFALAAKVLEVGGLVIVYGPFRYLRRPLEPNIAK